MNFDFFNNLQFFINETENFAGLSIEYLTGIIRPAIGENPEFIENQVFLQFEAVLREFLIVLVCFIILTKLYIHFKDIKIVHIKVKQAFDRVFIKLIRNLKKLGLKILVLRQELIKRFKVIINNL